MQVILKINKVGFMGRGVKKVCKSRGKYDLYKELDSRPGPCRTFSPSEIAKLKLGSEGDSIPACGKTIELCFRGNIILVSDKEIVEFLKKYPNAHLDLRSPLSDLRAKISKGEKLNGKEQEEIIRLVEMIDFSYKFNRK